MRLDVIYYFDIKTAQKMFKIQEDIQQKKKQKDCSLATI